MAKRIKHRGNVISGIKKKKDKLRIAKSQAELDFQKYKKSKQQQRFFIPITERQ